MKIDEDWSPEFAFQQVIQKQVEKEDLIGWAEKPATQVVEVRKLVVHKQRVGDGFPLQVWKYIQP